MLPARDQGCYEETIPIANVQPEPMMGIEPITYHLQGDCSTVELHRQNTNLLNNETPYDCTIIPKPKSKRKALLANSHHIWCNL